ncbi:hypothetical protein C8R46DRAFT_1195402 [Mycena filopes]|nr:hypothetical protein C8R46DRAFT_1195393 [Mycena filopes]KAJ7158096.1 hypothetical protein C8R46DRAFT_1195396 [Mycena filopes]KAJ7158099.1 hypothetical protein C8R46DRAFT_1195399 [Mycena filopes]KAJ7158102.1 hypothetical protein C8R46DRAFT_1195402 [Mycena filopes]
MGIVFNAARTFQNSIQPNVSALPWISAITHRHLRDASWAGFKCLGLTYHNSSSSTCYLAATRRILWLNPGRWITCVCLNASIPQKFLPLRGRRYVRTHQCKYNLNLPRNPSNFASAARRLPVRHGPNPSSKVQSFANFLAARPSTQPNFNFNINVRWPPLARRLEYLRFLGHSQNFLPLRGVDGWMGSPNFSSLRGGWSIQTHQHIIGPFKNVFRCAAWTDFYSPSNPRSLDFSPLRGRLDPSSTCRPTVDLFKVFLRCTALMDFYSPFYPSNSPQNLGFFFRCAAPT